MVQDYNTLSLKRAFLIIHRDFLIRKQDKWVRFISSRIVDIPSNIKFELVEAIPTNI
jgi:hypothetical protein